MSAIYECFLALFVWTSLTTVGLLLSVVIFCLSLYAVLWWAFNTLYCCRESAHRWLSDSNFEDTRQLYIQEAFPKDTSLMRHSIQVTMDQIKPKVDIDVSILYCPAATKEGTDGDVSEPQSLVVFHGVGSSATLLISSSLAALRAKYNVYVVDIPGFGTGTTSLNLNTLSADACLEFYAKFFDQLLRKLDLKKPFIVAHSVGAFLAVNSLWHKDRDQIGGMILVSPAGVLPTLSEIGAYWALLFYLGLPMSLFRALGRIAGSLLLLPILSNPRCARTTYWLQLQTSLAMVNIPAKFIDFSFTASFWNRPQLNHILNSKLPIAMIWGDQDNLLPIETGKLLVSIGHKLGKQFILEPVVGAGHSPFHVNGGNDFAVAMEKVMDQLLALDADIVKAASTAADEQAETEISVQIADVVDLQHGRWRSSFSTTITKNKVLELHAYIIQCVDKFVKT